MDKREEILKNFEPLIKSCIKKYYANNRSYEDALQDGKLKMLELIDSYRGGGKVSLECFLKYQMQYFYMHKYNNEKKLINSFSNNVYTLDDGQTEDVFESIADDVDIALEIEKKEEYRLLYEAMDELTDRQRVVVKMKFFYNMKNREIALELNISEETVKDHFSVAKKKIKKFFERRNYDRF